MAQFHGLIILRPKKWKENRHFFSISRFFFLFIESSNWIEKISKLYVGKGVPDIQFGKLWSRPYEITWIENVFHNDTSRVCHPYKVAFEVGDFPHLDLTWRLGVKSTSFRAERGRVPLQNCEEGDEQAFFLATKSVSVDSSRETNSLQMHLHFIFLRVIYGNKWLAID